MVIHYAPRADTSRRYVTSACGVRLYEVEKDRYRTSKAGINCKRCKVSIAKEERHYEPSRSPRRRY